MVIWNYTFRLKSVGSLRMRQRLKTELETEVFLIIRLKACLKSGGDKKYFSCLLQTQFQDA